MHNKKGLEMNFKARCDMVVKTYKALLAQTELRDIKNRPSYFRFEFSRGFSSKMMLQSIRGTIHAS